MFEWRWRVGEASEFDEDPEEDDPDEDDDEDEPDDDEPEDEEPDELDDSDEALDALD